MGASGVRRRPLVTLVRLAPTLVFAVFQVHFVFFAFLLIAGRRGSCLPLPRPRLGSRPRRAVLLGVLGRRPSVALSVVLGRPSAGLC